MYHPSPSSFWPLASGLMPACLPACNMPPSFPPFILEPNLALSRIPHSPHALIQFHHPLNSTTKTSVFMSLLDTTTAYCFIIHSFIHSFVVLPSPPPFHPSSPHLVFLSHILLKRTARSSLFPFPSSPFPSPLLISSSLSSLISFDSERAHEALTTTTTHLHTR